MLCLMRRKGEKIYVGEDIVFTILSIDRNRVRVGIDAPKSVTIYREEIYERIKYEQPTAATGGDDAP